MGSRIMALVMGLVLGASCGRGDKAMPVKAAAEDAGATEEVAKAAKPKGPATPPAPTVKAGGKGDCSTAYAPRPDRDPVPMCKVDGGTFMMGLADVPRSSPVRKVKVSPFLIDQFKATNEQVAYWLNQRGTHKGCTDEGPRRTCVKVMNHTGIRLVDGVYVPAEGLEKHPSRKVSHEGAVRYCKWAGKQLATEAQWEFAARHDPKTGRDFLYPWGDEFKPMHAPCEENLCKDGFESTTPAGLFDGTDGYGDGSSPWGVHDMVGNAAEFVSDCWREGYEPCDGTCTDPLIPFGDDCRQSTSRSTLLASPQIALRAGVRHGNALGSAVRCATRPTS